MELFLRHWVMLWVVGVQLPARFTRNSRSAFSRWLTFPRYRSAEVGAQHGRCPDAAGQRTHRAVPQHVHVIDGIGPAAMPATRHATFRSALTPYSPPGPTCFAT